jgi:translation initiation factor IF-2
MADGSTRIYELAKEFKISSSAMLKILRDLNFQPKSHMSVVSPEMMAAVKGKFAREKQEAKREMDQRQKPKLVKPAPPRAPAPPPPPAKPAASGAPAATGKPAATGTAAPKSSVTVSGMTVKTAKKSNISGLFKKIERKQRKKDRRKKKERRTVDKVEVAKSFKATMAGLSGGSQRKRYKRDAQSGLDGDQRPANLIEVNEFMSLAELAKEMDHKPAELIARLFEMGMMATINQRLDMDTIEMLASEFEFDVTRRAEVGEEVREQEHDEKLERRAPVVTIMGHVDHGKTSLLDFIREANVVATEAGAITQHIGAYLVKRPDGNIAFIDTPGHEAFTAMRARGAQITDIVVLVVAADDAVRPQTVEAIDHARAAGVPIIVAINKIDLPTANRDAIRTQLTEHNLVAEDWGGKAIMVDVSAKTGEGVDKLLEMILLQAEMMDLQADPTIRGQGVVIDSRLEKGRGPVVTVLIQRGTCSIGESIVAGTCCGRIRAMTDEYDQPLTKIGPSTPAQITGLHGVAQAGDSFMVAQNDQEAKQIALKRSQIKREQDSRHTHGRLSLDRVFDRIKEGAIKEIRLILKGDVDGSVEVMADTLGAISNEEVKTNIIHRAVGTITERDILLAAASDAIIIGFQVTMDSRARELTRNEHVDVRMYDVIYEAESDVRKALEGLLSPDISEKFVGAAEVRQLYKVPKVGTIAGCYVREGRINRKDQVRVVRDEKIVYRGTLSSLKRFRDDAREVKESFECGIGVENYNDLKVSDIIEAYELVETARTL